MSQTRLTLTNHIKELLSELAKYSLEPPASMDTEVMYRLYGSMGESTEPMPVKFSNISCVDMMATSAKPSQPTTQAPIPQPTVSTSTKSSGITPFYSDLADPMPEPFDPTIGESATTVWGDSVEVVGKTVSYDYLSGKDVTEYRVKRKSPKPNELETFYTRSLRRPEGTHTPRHHHSWAKYEGFTQRYQYCETCDEKRGWDD